jgi:nitrite reductase (NO-forming)
VRTPLISALLAVVTLTSCGVGEEPAAPGAAATSAHPTDPHSHAAGDDHGAAAPRVDVRGAGLKFDPAQIEVRRGEPTVVQLTAVDGEHDFRVDAIGAHIHALPGRPAAAQLTFAKTGTFEYYCSIAGHREGGMTGKLVVTQ